MEYELDDYQERILEQLYDKYDGWLRENKRMKDDSVLLSIIRSTNSGRSLLLRNTVEEYIDQNTAGYLIDLGLIRESDDRGKYAFTMSGLFYTETTLLKKDKFFTEGDKYYLDVFKKISISDRDRIILLTMVALRTFSEKSAINMRESDGVQDEWWSILNKISEMLVEEKVIRERTSLANYTISEIEHPASDVIRHSDRLPPATKNVFIKPGNNTYYLSVAKNGRIMTDILADVLELIFEDRCDSLYTLDFFSAEMRSFSRLYGVAVQSSMDENFFSSEFDDEITQAFDLVRIRMESKEADI